MIFASMQGLPRPWLVRLGAPLVASMLAGCASLSTDGGFGPVESATQQRLGKEVRWARTAEDQARSDARVAELLAKPALSMDDAVQLALFNNRGLQASFAQLGISDAELVQAGRLPNPGFSFGRLRRGDEVELERGVHLNLARLVALPWMKELESRRFAQTQGEVSLAALSLAADTRKAWVNAVAAEETVRYMRQVQQAAEASAELARRMAQVGNFNKLQQLREQSFYADAAQNLARAERASLSSREQLTRLLGLWGDQTRFKLPERLPDLPGEARDLPDIERTAMAQRLEQRAATQRLMEEHKAPARGLGDAVVQAEATLDRLFADRQATPERVNEATQRVASLRARLRAQPLTTRLVPTSLMSPTQTLRYAELRGYAPEMPTAPEAPGGQGPDHLHRH